jgi:hypothetical protein
VAEDDLNRRTPKEVLAAEARRLLRRIPDGAYVISLDREKGEPLSSEKLARRLNSLGLSGRSHVAFVLGGPLGLSREVLARTDTLISFGPHHPATRPGAGGSPGATLPGSEDKPGRAVPLLAIGCYELFWCSLRSLAVRLRERSRA